MPRPGGYVGRRAGRGNVKEHNVISMDVKNSRGPRMTPARFARDECANMLPDGACLGVSVDSLIDRGQGKTATPRDRCLVAEGKRCEYFERVILPLVDHPSPHGEPQLQAKRAWARREYLARHTLRRARDERRCPECGNPRPARHHFCETCASKHRRETYRRSQAGRREVRATVKA